MVSVKQKSLGEGQGFRAATSHLQDQTVVFSTSPQKLFGLLQVASSDFREKMRVHRDLEGLPNMDQACLPQGGGTPKYHFGGNREQTIEPPKISWDEWKLPLQEHHPARNPGRFTHMERKRPSVGGRDPFLALSDLRS